MKQLLLIISFVALYFTGHAQWNPNSTVNTPVSVQLYDQQDIKMCSDGKGGAIMVWVDFRNDAGMILADIYAQRIDKEGYTKWNTNGNAICTQPADQTAPVIMEDGNGGAIIAWQDFRNGTRDIFAQRVDSNGTALWTSNGVSVVSKSTDQRGPRMDTDGNGGAIIVWEDSVNGNWDIYAQRINNMGTGQWSTTGVAVCNATNSQINPRCVSDGNGGLIVTWQDKRNGNDYDIYVQKINSSGTPVLATNGISFCNTTNTQSNPKIASDHNNGAYVIWQDKRNGNDFDVYAQRLNSSNTAAWTNNGVFVCFALNSQSAIDITSDSISSGFIACWKDARSTFTNVYAQKISSTGSAQWTSNGILVSNSAKEQLNPNIIGDGSGGAIITWQENDLTSWDIVAQKINANGTIAWTGGGVTCANAASDQISPKNLYAGNGEAIFAFQDKRSGDNDIYACKTDASGSLATLSKDNNNKLTLNLYPNPNKGMFTIKSNGKNAKYEITDISGNKVLEGELNSSSQKINMENKATGVYFIKVYETNNTIVNSKIIIQ